MEELNQKEIEKITFNQMKNVTLGNRKINLRKDEVVDKGTVRRLRYCEQCWGLTMHKDNKCLRCYRI